MPPERRNVVYKLLDLLRYEKEEISSIYFYAIFNGLVQLSLPLGIQSIVSFVLSGAISTSIVLLVCVVILGVLVSGLLQVNQMKLIEKIQQQLFVRYSFQYAHTIPNINLLKIDQYYLPELVNRFMDTMSLQKGMSKLLLDVPAASIQILFGLILLCFYHPVFIFFGVVLLLVLFLIMRLTGTRGLQTSLEESDYKYKVVGYFEDLARVITTIKFSTRNALHITKTDKYVSGYLNARTSHFKILLFQYWTLIGFKLFITAAMLVVGVYLLLDQQLNVGQFIAAEIVILTVISSVEKLIVNLDSVYDIMTAVEKVTKLTEKPTELKGEIQPDVRNGIAIAATELSFGYEEAKDIVHGLNFSIGEGQKVCITGPSGSGKSTLLRLICGVYPGFKGSLLVNKVPILSYDLDSLRAVTGIMLQSQDIFEGSIKENICLGNETISYQDLDALAEITGLKPFILAHPEGYDYMLRPTGQHLSARIVKRILLMRALIHKPKLLLLEEPWAGLEDIDVQQIQQYLRSVDATVIVAANDEAFSKKCDQTIVLDKGRIKHIIFG